MIKKITKEEFDSMAFHWRGRSTHFYNAILKLKPDEGITIYKKEWQRHYAPTLMANRIAKKYGFTFEQGSLPDRTGWRVLRVK